MAALITRVLVHCLPVTPLQHTSWEEAEEEEATSTTTNHTAFHHQLDHMDTQCLLEETSHLQPLTIHIPQQQQQLTPLQILLQLTLTLLLDIPLLLVVLMILVHRLIHIIHQLILSIVVLLHAVLLRHLHIFQGTTIKDADIAKETQGYF